jgi:ubiquinone/menaquinone biosynthesis C-methylase UbiE
MSYCSTGGSIRAAYDRAAREYDSWKWQPLWRRNELPIVKALIREAAPARLRVLDVGTGTGLHLGWLIEEQHDAVGVDVSAGMLLRARENLSQGARLIQADVRALPFAPSSFDAVVCCRVLSHVSALWNAVSDIARVVRPGGWVLLSEVSAEHGYERTRIPVGSEIIDIETYKWTEAQLVACASQHGLAMLRRGRIHATDLKEPPELHEFQSLDRTGQRALSHWVWMQKSAR